MNTMKLAPLAVIITMALSGCNSDSDSKVSPETPTPPQVDTSIIKYVDPFIGTGFNGHTFPGAVVPEGMVQLSPDTELLGWHSSSGYHYDKDTLYGFSHTHLSGTGMGGLGDILFMPYVEGDQHEVVTLDKQQETASAGYYSVVIKENTIKAELTASERVGYHRYTYPEGQPQKLKVDLNSILNADWGSTPMRNKLTVIDDYTIIGERDARQFSGWAKNQKVYFVAKFDQKIKSVELYANNEKVHGNTAEHISEIITTETGDLKRIKADVTAFIEFEGATNQLNAQVALSGVSTEGAEKNLAAEGTDVTFDIAKANAAIKWHESLSDIKIDGGSEEEKEIFYTALYHTKIAPMIHQDVDGQYRGMADGKQVNTYQAEDGEMNFGVYSLWDTFRALHPLKTITEPDRAVDYAKNLITKYEQGGLLPKWEHLGDYTGTMVGYPAVAVIADAMTKFPEQFSDAERKLALEAAVASSTWHPEDYQHWDQAVLNRVMTPHIKYIQELGFAPAVEKDGAGNVIGGTAESVSYGLENAYYDWCIAQIARLAGDDAKQIEYMKRSQGYKRYFDHDPAVYAEHGTTGFMRPVMADGNWSAPFDPYNAIHETGNYTEGNAWQWTWFAPHDIDGLKYVMGGDDAFLKNLDATFLAEPEEGTPDMSGLIGQVAFGNEPSHHIPYLYNWTSEPWKTQEVVNYILDEMYFNQPAGIIGNEDVGSMSAWYVMSALGFYQVNGADPVYTIGRPLFDKAIIPVAGGEFTIVTENNSDTNLYVKSVTINGEPLTQGLFFKHSEFRAGGELKFVMTGNKAEANSGFQSGTNK